MTPSVGPGGTGGDGGVGGAPSGFGGDMGGAGAFGGGGGGGEGGGDCTTAATADYVVHLAKGPPTVDASCDEAQWQAAPTIPWPGGNSNDTNNASVDCKLLWSDDATDRVFGCCVVADMDVESVIDSHDDDVWLDDGMEAFFASHTAQPQWAATSTKVLMNVENWVRDAEYSSGTANVDYDANVTVVTTIDGSLDSGSGDDKGWTMEWAQDLGFDATPEDVIGCNFMMNDRDGGTKERWWSFGRSGGINDASSLHECKLACTGP